jgi:hypothetical protein
MSPMGGGQEKKNGETRADDRDRNDPTSKGNHIGHGVFTIIQCI